LLLQILAASAFPPCEPIIRGAPSQARTQLISLVLRADCRMDETWRKCVKLFELAAAQGSGAGEVGQPFQPCGVSIDVMPRKVALWRKLRPWVGAAITSFG
jgi:hypothetical protein